MELKINGTPYSELSKEDVLKKVTELLQNNESILQLTITYETETQDQAYENPFMSPSQEKIIGQKVDAMKDLMDRMDER